MLLALVLVSLIPSSEAKADSVRFTPTSTTHDLGSGGFILSGFFTNPGTVAFTANRWDVSFSPNLGPLSVTAIDSTSPNCCNYTQTVPGLSSSPILPLLEFRFIGTSSLEPGSYLATITFSGVAGSDLNVTTIPVQFTVTVPQSVPEPATLLLLSSGLMAGGAIVRRRLSNLKQKAGF
jgi:hypothetical protein